MAPDCEEWTLPDGTRVRVGVDTVGVSPFGRLQQMEALRPDGTHIQVFVFWQNDRSAPLTLDELERFADKFD